jgi:hypothetical protein
VRAGALPRIGAKLRDDAWAWVALAVAMGMAAVVVLRAARGLTFGADELSYFGRLVESDGRPAQYAFGLEYLLAPHNGHLQVGGKLVYEASFALFGAAHAPLRVAELAGLFACVALFFELARRRVGPGPALTAAVGLLFMGAAWELMLWPFDLHTTYSLAFGLGAVLALERDDHRGDLTACALLVASVAMIEVGLAFVGAAAVLVALGRDRLRRAWVVGVPLVLYAAWWLWARRFANEDVDLGQLGDLPGSVADSMTSVVAAFTGLYAHGAGVWPNVLDPEPAAAVVAALAAAGLAVAFWRAGVTPRAWMLIAALAAYWTLIALADRPPDSSRYTLAGVILLLLIVAEAARSWATSRRRRMTITGAVALVVALSLPVGLDKLSDGTDWSRAGSDLTRVEATMVELARDRVDPDFNPAARLFASTGVPAGAYLWAADRIGSLGISLDELRGLAPALRAHADQVLAGAYELEAVPADGPDTGGCRRAGEEPVRLAPGAAAFEGPPGGGELVLGRFSGTGVVELGPLAAGARVAVEIPPDQAGDPWWAFVDPRTGVCRVG